jgi:soluble lytic murein transglycosylase-like protein
MSWSLRLLVKDLVAGRARRPLASGVAMALVLVSVPTNGARAEPAPAKPEPSDAAIEIEADPVAAQEELCALIETAADDNGLPVGFFTRLIWKESRFRHDAVSPKGAQGIAQFMPGTALERGLDDPFDARTAIPASANLLADLKDRFGNLGLAAAAYNAGVNRVHEWLSDAATLPYETRDYVLSITGTSAETWADSDAPRPPVAAEGETDCLALAALLKGPGSALAPEIETAEAPWGAATASC